MSARKKRGSSGPRKGRQRPTARDVRNGMPGDKALTRAFGTADALLRQIGSKRRRPRKPVTLKQVLQSVAMILVLHLSSFDYRKQIASPRARVARMLAALSVRLGDTVAPKRAR